MRKTQSILTLIIFFLLSANAQKYSFRDIIYTSDGEEFRGELLDIREESIIFAIGEDTLVVPKGEVIKISLGKNRPGDTWREISDIDDDTLLAVLNRLPNTEDFGGASYIVLFESDEFIVSRDGAVEHNHRRISLVLDEAGKDAVALSERYYFADSGDAQVLFARSISPNGSVKHLDDSAIQRGPVNAFYAGYDRLWLLKCAPGNIEVGSIVDIAEREKKRTSSTLDPFHERIFFQTDAPILTKILTIKTENKKSVHSDEVNWLADWQKADIREEGDNAIFAWRRDNIPAVVFEFDSPPKEYFMPFVSISAGGGWQEIARDFSDAEKSALDSVRFLDEILKKKIPGGKTAIEKSARMFEWVLENTHLVDVSPSEYFFAPTPISRILHSLSANSLDRAFLFCALARRAGLDAKIGFVSENFPENFQLEKNPSLRIVPHPFACVVIDKNPVYLDFNDDFMPPFVLRDEIIGQKGVILSDGNPQFITIPREVRNEELSEMRIIGKIDKKGNLDAEMRVSYAGSGQRALKSLEALSREELSREMQRRVAKIHPIARLKKWCLTGMGRLADKAELRISFWVDGYAEKTDSLLIFKLPAMDGKMKENIPSKRDLPFWLGAPSRSKYTATLKFPRGYSVFHRAKDADLRTDFAEYFCRSDMMKCDFHYEDSFRDKGGAVPPERYEEYREVVRARNAVRDDWIILIKNAP